MKVLVIGFGSIGRRHSTILKEIDPTIEIYALRSKKPANQFASVHNVYNYHEIDFTPNFIIISNPTARHTDAVAKGLSFNCPLFIEKPLSHDFTQASDLLSKIEKQRILTYIGCNLRFHPCLQFIKKHLSGRPAINEVNIYSGSYLPDWRPEADYRKVYSANAAMGGGVHLDLIHEIDYAYWFFGNPLSSSKLLRNNSTLNISSVDYANYNLVYPNFVVNIVLNYYRREAKRSLELVFEDRSWTVNLLENRITEGDRVIFQEDIDPNFTYRKQWDYFINCIQNAMEPMNSYREALEVLKIALD